MEQLVFPITEREAKNSGITYSSDNNKNALFPSQLRNERKKKGISQADLARVLGVSKSTIGLWETGDTLPDAKALHDLADYFEVSADYLLCFTTDSHRTPRAADDLGISREAVNVLSFMKSETFKKHDNDIVSKFIGSFGFVKIIAQIDYLSRLVDEVKQLPHSELEEWGVKESVDTKSWEKDLSNKLGYPVYVMTPDKRLAAELQIVRDLAGNLAKEISGMETKK